MAIRRGTPGNDRLLGTLDSDVLYGIGGDDRLRGLAGDDHLHGGKGDDTLLGGEGNDRVWGGDGNDRLDGGDGRDLLFGDAGDDYIYGGGNYIRLYGEAGDDFFNVLGPARAATISGGPGADTIYLDGTDGGAITATITDFVAGQDSLIMTSGPASDPHFLSYLISACDRNDDGKLTRDDGVSQSTDRGSYAFTDAGLELSLPEGNTALLLGVDEFF